MPVVGALIVHSHKGPTITSIPNDDFVYYRNAYGKDTFGDLPLPAERSYEHTKIFLPGIEPEISDITVSYAACYTMLAL